MLYTTKSDGFGLAWGRKSAQHLRSTWDYDITFPSILKAFTSFLLGLYENSRVWLAALAWFRSPGTIEMQRGSERVILKLSYYLEWELSFMRQKMSYEFFDVQQKKVMSVKRVCDQRVNSEGRESWVKSSCVSRIWIDALGTMHHREG